MNFNTDEIFSCTFNPFKKHKDSQKYTNKLLKNNNKKGSTPKYLLWE